VTDRGRLVEAGNYQHGLDGLRYLAWRFLPRPQPPKPAGFDTETFDAIRRIKVLTNG
jgi:hypothetical protein